MADRSIRVIRAAVALALAGALAGCVGFPGGMPGGGYGSPGGYGYPPSQGAQALVGTVQGFDPGSGRLSLSPEGGYGGYGGGVELWVDRSTRLYYQGQQQDVSGLERGDRIRVDVQDDGRRLLARTIEVVQNVRESGAYGGQYGGAYGGDSYGASALEGAVRYVDTRRRVIELTRGGYSGQAEQVWYDERTRFDYRGQRVSPEQLEAGDIVRIDARRSGNGWIADTVWVTVDARSR